MRLLLLFMGVLILCLVLLIVYAKIGIGGHRIYSYDIKRPNTISISISYGPKTKWLYSMEYLHFLQDLGMFEDYKCDLDSKDAVYKKYMNIAHNLAGHKEVISSFYVQINNAGTADYAAISVHTVTGKQLMGPIE